MEISEIRQPITQGQVLPLIPIFTEAFGEPPSDSFLERLNEKKDLSLLIARSGDALLGFKIGYARFKGVYFSWLGAVASGCRRQGIARKLVRHQHGLAAERGYHELQTEAEGSNRSMLILNLQEGFEVCGVGLGRGDALTVQLRKRLE